ncbi:MAG: FtsX-like permease family protein [Ruminococcus sp.]|nr:FtsX-like permease family protein [Clostridia bacterium]MBQ7133995.1 FtsX-like permease family protein [Ruminococcus sp.]
MYLNILKRDLKRKKTMNVILLIFVMLSAMFMASSVNNILAVTTGLDTFFEEAGMADHYVLALDDENDSLEKALKELNSTTEYKREDIFYALGSNVEINGKAMKDLDRTALVLSVDNRQLSYFSPDNKEITEVEKGKAYISGPFASEAKLEVGEKFTLVIGEHRLELEYAGRAKDALLGSDFMGNPRFILNDADYKYLLEDEEAQKFDGSVYYIKTTDTSAVESTIGEQGGIILSVDNDTIKTTYIMSMIVAALLLIVSLFLIIVSFVVLKHTIGFTIAEEFREIGIMKAIGMKNSSIRALYLTKYCAITLVGSAIGFALSVPFSKFMLKSVSASMYLDNENSVLVSLICSIAVVIITLLFCWSSTSKVNKLSPIDAVRNGQTGERFKKKSILQLRKSKLGSNVFLATNDIVSAPKKYSIITIVFAMLMLLVMILANTANTLNSDKLLFLLSCTESDVYLFQTDASVEALNPDVNPETVIQEAIIDIKNTLKENDMPGDVHIESLYTTSVLANGKKSGVPFQYCSDTKASDYTYGEGLAPQDATEVALSYLTADKLGVGVGDEITILANGEERKCTVTALFQTFQQMGTVCRLHEDFDVSKLDVSGIFAFQIDFDDEPNEAEIENRIEKLKDIFDTNQVYNCADFVKDCTGAADTIESVKNLVLIITLVIVILVAVLMERSFISAEKAEIALMKAIGFSNKSIIWHHTLRFGIVAFIASILAAIFCMPITKLAMDPVMGIMGAVSGVGYEIVFAEIFLLYPAILIAVTIISAFFTSIYTNTIKSSDASNIE